MDYEPKSDPAGPAIIMHLRLLLGLSLVFLVGAAVFACLALRKLDRVVIVVENVNDKVNRAADAAAPLGQAAVDRGVQALDAVDTEDLGRAATEGVKAIGRSAKERAIEIIRQKQAERSEPK